MVRFALGFSCIGKQTIRGVNPALGFRSCKTESWAIISLINLAPAFASILGLDMKNVTRQTHSGVLSKDQQGK